MLKSDSNGATPPNTSNFLKICNEIKTVLLSTEPPTGSKWVFKES